MDEICNLMRKRHWRQLGFGVLGIAGGGMLAADAVITRGALAIAGNSLGLPSAVYGAFEGRRTKQQILGRPLAYAALAKNEAARAIPFRRSALSRLRARLARR